MLEGSWVGRGRLEGQLNASGGGTGKVGQRSLGCELEEGFRGRKDMV